MQEKNNKPAENIPSLAVSCSSFDENGWIPLKHSARGADISPEIRLQEISPQGKTIAVTLEDISHPLFHNYTHWLIWNLPAEEIVPEGIPHGAQVNVPQGALQGIAYGRHRYKGPKPPFNTTHTYLFTVYVLSQKLNLSANTKKKDFLAAAKGYILQKGTVQGRFQSNRKEK